MGWIIEFVLEWLWDGFWPEKKGKPRWVRLIWILMPPLIFLGLIGVLWLLLS